MGIMDKLVRRRPKPGTGQSGETEELEEVKVPETEDMLDDIEKVLNMKPADEQKQCGCGCFC